MGRIVYTKPQAQVITGQEKFKLFCGGFGSGKTDALIGSVIKDLHESRGSMVAVYAPTYDLITLNILPRFEATIGKAYHGAKMNKKDWIYDIPRLGKVLFRSLANSDRIIAYEVYRSHIDELDTLATDKATDVWNKIMARNRGDGAGENRVSAYTTPEGFKFCYKRWEKDRIDGYRMYRAPTYSNPHIPDDYVDTLRLSYPDYLVDAYIEGKFVNLTSGAVYRDFSRENNNTDRIIKKGEPLHIGMDFNVYNMAGVVFAPTDYDKKTGKKKIEICDEFIGYDDTPAMIEAIRERYPKNKVYVYPDAAGKHKNSTGASVTDHKLLKEAGFKVKARKSNPLWKDRIQSVNRLYRDQELFINVERCPETVENVEQQVYDKNGIPDKHSDTDHSNDGLGYRICYDWLLSKPKMNYKSATS